MGSVGYLAETAEFSIEAIGCPRAVSRGDWRPLATGGGFSKLAMVLRSTGARLASGGRNDAGQDS
jgi:hypothetical protein